MPKKLLGVLLVAVLLLACPLSVGALSTNSVPYTTYDYNFYDESIAAPAGYIPAEKITADSLGLEKDALINPTDIYFDKENDTIYLLDSGNEFNPGRIFLLDSNFKLKYGVPVEEEVPEELPEETPEETPEELPEGELPEEETPVEPTVKEKSIWDDFYDKDGAPIMLNNAEGLAIGVDGMIYIADTGNERILVFNPDRTLFQEILSPAKDAHFDSDLPFDVTRVMVDNRKNLYAIVRSVNMGALVFSLNDNGAYEYVRYFGGNKVQQTSEVVMKYLLRPFLTQAQLEGMVTSTPINISSFDVDGEGFVYTCTQLTGITTATEGMIRKLNYLGDNILDAELIFGDLEWDRKSYVSGTRVTTFIDLDVDELGFINMLDKGRGRVFQYTERGELIAVFGAYGQQFGTFDNPTSVESVGDKVVVVDSIKRSLTVFKPTAYGEKYREAIVLLSQDDFSGSLKIWEGLLEENSNNAQAYYGIGRVYDMQGNYKEAMKNFKLAGDRISYSNSFEEYRNDLIKQWFLPIVIVVAALYILSIVLKILRKKKVKAKDTSSAYSKLESKYTFPLYTLFHPADGFQQLKPRKIGSWRVVGILLVALFTVFTLQFFVTGYIHNLNRAIDYSLPIMVLKTIGIAFLFIISNWAVCTLFNGNGNLKEIACVTAYSLLPLIAAMAINVVASNFLSGSEGALMNIVLVVGILWTFLLLMCGLSAIHEYNMTQTFFSAIATVIGMAVIVFLLIMFFSLMQQTVSFVQSIVIEAVTR